eukprot:m.82391 g.82391  ORF g.82391 m.82391 type:complete len:421 (+) comp12869_c0_seq1:293-1555(+)
MGVAWSSCCCKARSSKVAPISPPIDPVSHKDDTQTASDTKNSLSRQQEQDVCDTQLEEGGLQGQKHQVGTILPNLSAGFAGSALPSISVTNRSQSTTQGSDDEDVPPPLTKRRQINHKSISSKTSGKKLTYNISGLGSLPVLGHKSQNVVKLPALTRTPNNKPFDGVTYDNNETQNKTLVMKSTSKDHVVETEQSSSITSNKPSSTENQSDATLRHSPKRKVTPFYTVNADSSKVSNDGQSEAIDSETLTKMSITRGSKVELHSLKAAAFNGILAEIQSVDTNAQRYICRLATGQITKVKPKNVRLISLGDEDGADVPVMFGTGSPTSPTRYNFVVNNCSVEQNAVLENTRRNSIHTTMTPWMETSFEREPLTPRSRSIRFADECNKNLNNTREFNLTTPVKFLLEDASLHSNLPLETHV